MSRKKAKGQSDNEQDDVVFADLELERKLLRYIMIEDSALLPYISENIFYGQDENIIFNVLKKIQTILNPKIIESVFIKQLGDSVYQEIEYTIEHILKAPKLGTFKAAELILQSLQDLYKQRTIIECSEAAINFAKEEMIDDALHSLVTVLRNSVDLKIQTGEYVEDFEERLESLRQAETKKDNESLLIPTGIVQFDNVAGGIKRGEVGVVVAATGGGKSISMLNFAVHDYLQGFNVIHVGLEMSKFENMYRADSLLTEIPAKLFRLASLTQNDYKIWMSRIQQLKKSRKNYIEFIGGKSLTLVEIIALCEGIEAKHNKKCDLVVLDHYVLIKDDTGLRDFNMQLWNIFERITEWALKDNKAIWTGSQSTDEGITRKKGMRVIDVKYARAVAELAHILIALYQGEIDEACGDLNMAVRKGRGIKAGDEIILKPDFDRMILDTRSFALHRLNVMETSKKKSKNQIQRNGSQGKLGI